MQATFLLVVTFQCTLTARLFFYKYFLVRPVKYNAKMTMFSYHQILDHQIIKLLVRILCHTGSEGLSGEGSHIVRMLSDTGSKGL